MKLKIFLSVFLSAGLMMLSSASQADYTCSANPDTQYLASITTDTTSSGGYSATINGIGFKDVSAVEIGGNVDFYTADGHFNLWISTSVGLNGVGFQSNLSASATDDQNQSILSLFGIPAICSGSMGDSF